jgi:APA family basic amino acid/polyamine antiporter
VNIKHDTQRHMGLVDATGVGVGAIVGGGILALAGAAFAATGPSAILAFALNGVIALLTALSFADVSSKFPESGGTYVFAKKVLSVEAAFTVGWVVWFASIVAAVLYALGFGEFASVMLDELWRVTLGDPPAWLRQRPFVLALAIGATGFYSLGLMWKGSGGGQWANVGKMIVFAILILSGLWYLPGRSTANVADAMTPFFAAGGAGLIQAMGFTFIALQGFDLIAAVAGEIRDPSRTIPRSMFASLAIALAIYLPLLFVLVTVGMPVGQSITQLSRENPETLIAIAAENYLGAFGFWLVVIGAVFSMLSALQANLFAASRVAMSMARDRTLPRSLASLSETRKTPVPAILATATLVIVILVVLPNVAAAGAASSLIFLITFALAHWIAILVRQRSQQQPPPFRSPLFPAVPVVGGFACAALAIYQGVAVPSAGRIAMAWLCVGGLLFLGHFAHRARVVDASSAALDPELVRLRGLTPLVLVPVANPDSAAGLITVANALAPPSVGRVLTLSIVVAPPQWEPTHAMEPVDRSQRVLREAIAASIEAGIPPEALTTVAVQPWPEIARVAKSYRCESLLLGFSQLSEDALGTPLEKVMSEVNSDVVVLRAAKKWRLSDVCRVLVPIGGRGGHDHLRARLLASLSRSSQREVTFLQVVAPKTSADELARRQRELRNIAVDLWPDEPRAIVTIGESAVDTIAEYARETDLIVLGVQRVSRRQKFFGRFALQVARKTTCPLLLICRRG